MYTYAHTGFPGATYSTTENIAADFAIDETDPVAHQITQALHKTTTDRVLSIAQNLLVDKYEETEDSRSTINKMFATSRMVHEQQIPTRFWSIYSTTDKSVGQTLWVVLSDFVEEMSDRMEVWLQRDLRRRQFDANENRRNNTMVWPNKQHRIVKNAVELRPKVGFIGRL